MREIYHRIRTGSIRPEESYDGPQSGSSRAELEAEIARLRSRCEEQEKALLEKAGELEKLRGMIIQIKGFAQQFDRTLFTGWPLCSTRRVWNMLSIILLHR